MAQEKVIQWTERNSKTFDCVHIHSKGTRMKTFGKVSNFLEPADMVALGYGSSPTTRET
jgi:hypothetical protein